MLSLENTSSLDIVSRIRKGTRVSCKTTVPLRLTADRVGWVVGQALLVRICVRWMRFESAR